MLLYWLASGDYTVGVIVWTDTGQTYISIILALILRDGFPGLDMILLIFMAEGSPKEVFRSQ